MMQWLWLASLSRSMKGCQWLHMSTCNRPWSKSLGTDQQPWTETICVQSLIICPLTTGNRFMCNYLPTDATSVSLSFICTGQNGPNNQQIVATGMVYIQILAAEVCPNHLCACTLRTCSHKNTYISTVCIDTHLFAF